jgi:ribosomal protein S18 acetylase RimI-like enzyme
MSIKLRRDLRAKIRRDGLLSASRWLVQYLATVPYERIEFIAFARSLKEPLPTAQPGIPVTMRLATEADLPLFRDIVLPSEHRHFAQRLAHGRLCFLTFPEGEPEELAAYCWATTEIDPQVDRVILDLPPGNAYVDDAYTVPTYRRRGIQTAVHLFRLRHLQSLGCARAMLIVDVKNEASLALVHNLGYRKVGRASFRRVMRTITHPLTVVQTLQTAGAKEDKDSNNAHRNRP